MILAIRSDSLTAEEDWLLVVEADCLLALLFLFDDPKAEEVAEVAPTDDDDPVLLRMDHQTETVTLTANPTPPPQPSKQ